MGFLNVVRPIVAALTAAGDTPRWSYGRWSKLMLMLPETLGVVSGNVAPAAPATVGGATVGARVGHVMKSTSSGGPEGLAAGALTAPLTWDPAAAGGWLPWTKLGLRPSRAATMTDVGTNSDIVDLV